MSSGAFWVTPPISRSDGEPYLRHGCLEKYLRRRRITRTSEGDNVAGGHTQLEHGVEKPNESSKDNSCVFFPSNDIWSIY